MIYAKQSQHKKAIEYYERSLKIKEELSDKKGMASVLGNLGIAYKNLSDYPKALDHYHRSLVILNESKDQAGIGRAYMNIGVVYKNQSDYRMAMESYLKAKNIFEKLGLKINEARCLANIANINSFNGDFEKAESNLKEVIKLYTELGIRNGLAINYLNLANIYADQSNYGDALLYFTKAKNIYEDINIKDGLASAKGNIGSLHLKLYQDDESKSKSSERNLIKSIKYLEDAIKLYEIIDEQYERSQFIQSLSIAYEKKGDFKKSLAYHKKYIKLKDSVFNLEKAKEIGKIEAEREQLEKEYELKEKSRIQAEKDSQRNNLQYLAIGALVVAFGVLLLLSGKLKIKVWIARALVFLTFILLFEFILVMIDPITDDYSEGIPIIKFSINLALALIIFPMHQFFEKRVSLKVERKSDSSTEKILEEFVRNKDKN